MHLYETHLPVADTERSRRFYEDVVGLTFGYRDPGRDIVFMYVGLGKGSMIGLWGPGTAYGAEPRRCHLAFGLSLAELLVVGGRLNGLGVATRNFAGDETTEPSVIGWMPSAQLYFRDPDGHSLEYIAVLEEEAEAGFVGTWAEWHGEGRLHRDV